MKTEELADKLAKLLKLEEFTQDVSLNGLQVGDESDEVNKVAFAVDACQASIEKAVELHADMLVVHHGLFWGKPIPVTGSHYTRIKTMIDNNLSLFACHIPLDANLQLGNNAMMAKYLGLENIEVFGEFRGMPVGCKGILPQPLTNNEIIDKLEVRTGSETRIIAGGKTKNKTVGIISGSAASDVYCALDSGLDVFITGESEHAVYHDCMERKINMLCLGHYETETFGVKALCNFVKANFGLETCFIDVPTGF